MAQIIVVEDDVYMREELIDVLEKAGYDAVPLLDFENAVSQIMSLSPDLILLDINLPFHSGFEICKEVKAKQLGTVLILTARDKLQDELHALGLGADDYLTKPCNTERLLARIKNLLRRKEEQMQQGLLNGAASCLIQTLLRSMQERNLMFFRRMRENTSHPFEKQPEPCIKERPVSCALGNSGVYRRKCAASQFYTTAENAA